MRRHNLPIVPLLDAPVTRRHNLGMGAVLVLAAIGLAIFLWRLRILLTLLRAGPTASREGWLASIIVVTILGPFGALIYLTTRPDRHPTSSDRTL